MGERVYVVGPDVFSNMVGYSWWQELEGVGYIMFVVSGQRMSITGAHLAYFLHYLIAKPIELCYPSLAWFCHLN